MIWPFSTEAKRIADEESKRRKREVEEMSGEIRRLSKEIVDAMNCEKMLIPMRKKT